MHEEHQHGKQYLMEKEVVLTAKDVNSNNLFIPKHNKLLI